MGDVYLSTYVAANSNGLSYRAYRVLLRMALVVYDRDTEPGANDEGLYYGGWRGLTTCLGYGVVLEGDPIPPTAERAIARALRKLRDAGYIDLAPKRTQRAHWNRVYKLSLANVPLT